MTDRCKLAPDGKRCEWEDVKDDLICCQANCLHAAFRELLRSIPIIGKWFEPYQCKAFEEYRQPWWTRKIKGVYIGQGEGKTPLEYRPIVPCSECVHADKGEHEFCMNEIVHWKWDASDSRWDKKGHKLEFCSYGERKKNGV